MKKKIHPQTHPVVFVDTSCGAEFVTRSTLTSEKKRDINGVAHFVIPIEISSASHPFFTGKQVLVDTARRVEKFQARAEKQATTAQTRKGKKVKRAGKAKAKDDAKKTSEKTTKQKKTQVSTATEATKDAE